MSLYKMINFLILCFILNTESSWAADIGPSGRNVIIDTISRLNFDYKEVETFSPLYTTSYTAVGRSYGILNGTPAWDSKSSQTINATPNVVTTPLPHIRDVLSKLTIGAEEYQKCRSVDCSTQKIDILLNSLVTIFDVNDPSGLLTKDLKTAFETSSSKKLSECTISKYVIFSKLDNQCVLEKKIEIFSELATIIKTGFYTVIGYNIAFHTKEDSNLGSCETLIGENGFLRPNLDSRYSFSVKNGGDGQDHEYARAFRIGEDYFKATVTYYYATGFTYSLSRVKPDGTFLEDVTHLEIDPGKAESYLEGAALLQRSANNWQSVTPFELSTQRQVADNQLAIRCRLYIRNLSPLGQRRSVTPADSEPATLPPIAPGQ